MSGTNPFAALLENDEASFNPKVVENEADKNKEGDQTLNSLLERIFAFSLNEEVANSKGYMFLGNEQGCLGNKELDFNILSYCLFERLFSCNKDNPLLLSTNTKGHDIHSTEHQVIVYLYTCYKIYKEETGALSCIDDYSVIKEEIFRNAATAYIHPDIYFEQNLHEQLIDILKEEKLYSEDFFRDLCHAILNHEESDDSTLKQVFESFVSILTTEIIKMPISTFDMRFFIVIKAFIMEENFAVAFMECIQPQKPNSGISFATTLLGSLINISILPKTPGSGFEHFQNMLSQTIVETTESLLWEKAKLITEQIYQIIFSLLKSGPIVKEKMLTWLGLCLKANSDREKLWNAQVSPALFPANYSTVTDGFMVQLGSILTRLCQPFCKDKKILKVDPTYCAVTNELLSGRQIHLPGMSEQTCLLPAVQDDDNAVEQRLMADSFNFTTECFFMAHRTMHLGFAIAVDKAVRMNHEIGRIERAYNEARQQAVGNSDFIDDLKDRLSSEMSKFLSYKAQLSEPNMLASTFDLISSTCYWLCQVVVHQDSPTGNGYAPMPEVSFSFPLPDRIPNTLKCIPEFIVGNVVCFVVFLMRFSPKDLEEQGREKMEPILTFILMFMGNHGLIKNPHLRAQLAEALEALLPVHREESSYTNNFQRSLLFSNYEFKKQVVRSLLEVFVGIEMTGQSVEFEQKFNYRRPMYGVMEYLWDREEYQHFFRELAEEAEENMEAVSPPIFLRFINLLMNDAVFLLDESLTNMAKLREMQAARDSGEWDRLPLRERTQNLGYLRHTGIIARFDNILGRDTIMALEKLTSKITIVFTHSTMVDRMAAMLNYFLLNLVGPNMKNFKVKDQKEYHFDPAETVLKICKIYINLKESDAFCLAVSQDGRSYSPNLFSLAEGVLVRIGGSSFIQEMQELAEKVAAKAAEYQVNEEAVAEAPEHFLDPIMSTLMTDPVILPSSRQIVDRTTIARHLLSDQTDPFNRSPLSMDQIIPHTELAKEIKEWIDERRNR
ncbi:hypothetical protein HHI36_019352 [Cryptolaemus montrouzieri]|uniref:Ubiquitin conjugation factor E4 A n=1 Tax=Cryptolaemus montrouzieri TaxID=559131 RepID=A0ABD2P3J5_9CUCU